ncbi:MAG: VOC family protein, partial [Alphaproteobacteria bacterium]|nr:VOC family protein [Alphaproteobacteria bacterium]
MIDFDGLGSKEAQSMRALRPEKPVPFRIDKIGHVVLKVRDLERSAAFYTKVLGFQVTDFYPDSMMKGRMLFMRCNADHHGVALVGGADAR